MGCHSTDTYTREKAIEYIIEQVESVDNETLKMMMDGLLYKQGYNCMLVDENGNRLVY